VKSILKFLALFSLLTVLVGSQVALSALAGNYLMTVLLGATYLLFSAILYATYVGKRKKQYPQVLLDGNDDFYFPRSNIPRPLHEDFRKYPEYFEKKEDQQTQAQT
jgi:hypothetical protein